MLRHADGRFLRLCTAALLANLLWPGVILAHDGQDAFIHVPLDHVLPGDTFPVVVADMGAGATVTLRLVQGTRVAELGHVVADADGHFVVTLQLPADFPRAYSELVAIGDDGTEASTWVLVGQRSEAPVSQSATGQGISATTDPSVLMLVGVLGGAAVALGWLLVRGRRQAGAAPVHTARHRIKSKRRPAPCP